MKNVFLTLAVLFCSLQVSGQKERLLRNSLTSEGSDGTVKFLEVFTTAHVHFFESEENGKRLIFLRGLVPYRFLDNSKVMKDAVIYQRLDTVSFPVAKLTEDYSGALMVFINLLKDTVADVGFYVYAEKKDLDLNYVVERQFEKFIKDKKFSTKKHWEWITQEFGFWGGQIWKDKYYVNLCYEEYTLKDYLDEYRLLVIFDKDSIPVAYAHKDTKINVKFTESYPLNKSLTLKFIKPVDEADRKRLVGLLNDFYLN